jgi:hypothetical protein
MASRRRRRRSPSRRRYLGEIDFSRYVRQANENPIEWAVYALIAYYGWKLVKERLATAPVVPAAEVSTAGTAGFGALGRLASARAGRQYEPAGYGVAQSVEQAASSLAPGHSYSVLTSPALRPAMTAVAASSWRPSDMQSALMHAGFLRRPYAGVVN